MNTFTNFSPSVKHSYVHLYKRVTVLLLLMFQTKLNADRVPCHNTVSWCSITVKATFILFFFFTNVGFSMHYKTLPLDKGHKWSLEIIFLERKSTNDPNKYFVKETLLTEKKFDRVINMSPQQNPY